MFLTVKRKERGRLRTGKRREQSAGGGGRGKRGESQVSSRREGAIVGEEEERRQALVFRTARHVLDPSSPFGRGQASPRHITISLLALLVKELLC